MSEPSTIRLNALNYDAATQTVDFSLRGKFGDGLATITGQVPLTVVAPGDVRSLAKAAVLQALAEAMHALEDESGME